MKPLNTSPENQSLLSQRRSELIDRITPAEAHIRGLLLKMKVKHSFQKGFFSFNTHYIVDFYFKRPGKLCLEIDGEYHNSPQQIAYDKGRTIYLTKVRGFRVVRLTNERAMSMDEKSLEKFLTDTQPTNTHDH